jgi:hypothetical protein
MTNHDDSIAYYYMYCIYLCFVRLWWRPTACKRRRLAHQPAMPCHAMLFGPFTVRDALTSCSCMMHPVLEQPWRSGESKSTKCTRGACRMGARAVSGFARRLCRRLRCLRPLRGEWDVGSGGRRGSHGIGHSDWGRRAAMSDGLLISADVC